MTSILSPTITTLLPLQTVIRNNPARIAAFNFGIQLVWGAILAVSLQARCVELAGTNAITGYALIAAVGSAIAAIVQIFGGKWADAIAECGGKRRIFYLVGTLLAIPMLLAFFSAVTFTQLICAFFGLQIAMNIASGPYQAVIPDHADPSEHNRISSWMSIYQSLGSAVGLLIAGFINSNSLIALLLIVGLSIPCGITYLHLSQLPSPPYGRRANFLSVRESLVILLLSRGLINMGFYTLLGFLVFFVRDSLHIFSPAGQRMQAALLFLTFTLTGTIGAIAATRTSHNDDLRQLITLANAVIIGSLMLLSTTHLMLIAYLSAATAGIGWGAFITADWVIACVILPKHAIATTMGIWNLASIIPQILAPILAAPLVLYGDILQAGLGPRLAFVAAAVMFFLGTLCTWRIPMLQSPMKKL